MRRIRHLSTTRQIIQPIQARLLADPIHPAQQQIHIIRLPAPQTPRQLPSHKRRYLRWAQIDFIPHTVEGDVGLDELGELDGVACFAGEGEEVVPVQRAGFVVGRFEDCGAAHGGFGGGEEDKVFACYAEEDFPGAGVRLGWVGGG
jgi:hypothetical protein